MVAWEDMVAQTAMLTKLKEQPPAKNVKLLQLLPKQGVLSNELSLVRSEHTAEASA